jgi:probable rRNA maturation factor
MTPNTRKNPARMSDREGGRAVIAPMIESQIDVEIEDAAWTGALPDAESLALTAALAALGSEPSRPLVVLLADDAAVRALNAQFRGKDYATNVLSFPAAPQPGPTAAQPLGDLALAFGVCAAEAKAQGKPLADHLRHLVVHGVLHLLGHDHEDDAEAEAMEALEREILSALCVPDPYLVDGGADHV